mmetsp:Transcript_34823/g.100248  ORF Transcript_34823/g.100248 Transcript_34823/m.100248 type:complete len:230 (+) Transcript_34823:906-1595(+)
MVCFLTRRGICATGCSAQPTTEASIRLSGDSGSHAMVAGRLSSACGWRSTIRPSLLCRKTQCRQSTCPGTRTLPRCTLARGGENGMATPIPAGQAGGRAASESEIEIATTVSGSTIGSTLTHTHILTLTRQTATLSTPNGADRLHGDTEAVTTASCLPIPPPAATACRHCPTTPTRPMPSAPLHSTGNEGSTGVARFPMGTALATGIGTRPAGCRVSPLAWPTSATRAS